MRVLISLILLYILTTSCANIQSPPGGAGDTTAPSIEYSYPEDKTINFQDDEIRIGFDEYMNRSKVIENLHITPDVPMTFDWSSTELEISFMEPLEPNTTYAISLGTEFTDYYNNAPKSSFSFIFSTGNNLDSGSIRGKIFAKDTKGKYVYLYKASNGEFPDMAKEKPDYFVSIGSSGTYEFVALKPGVYRLLAIDDKFQNKIYDDQVDAFGTSLNDVTLTEDKLISSVPDIHLGGKTDLLGPKLLSASSHYSGIVNLLFDENLDYNTLIKTNFKLTFNDEVVPVIGLGINKLTTSELIIAFDKKMAGKELKIDVLGVADSSGNMIQDTASYTNFIVDTTFNNSDFNIVSTNLNDSTQKNISPDFNIFDQFTPFRIKFNKIPDINSLINSSYLESNENKIDLKLVSDNLLDFYFVSENSILENTDYTLHFDTKNITDLWGHSLLIDTVYKTKFKTKFSTKLSSISGLVKTASGCEGNLIVTAKNVTDKTEYRTVLTNNSWKFEKVTPGSYLFEIFCDANKNNKYDFGNVVPFEFREKYSKSKSYKIDENWEYKDINLNLDE